MAIIIMRSCQIDGKGTFPSISYVISISVTSNPHNNTLRIQQVMRCTALLVRRDDRALCFVAATHQFKQ